MKAFRMAAYWPLLKWNSARSVGASTDTTCRSMKLMVVSPSNSAIRMKSAPRVKTGSNFGAAAVGLGMGSQYHRCAGLAPSNMCFSTQRRRERRGKRREDEDKLTHNDWHRPATFLGFLCASLCALCASALNTHSDR